MTYLLVSTVLKKTKAQRQADEEEARRQKLQAQKEKAAADAQKEKAAADAQKEKAAADAQKEKAAADAQKEKAAADAQKKAADAQKEKAAADAKEKAAADAQKEKAAADAKEKAAADAQKKAADAQKEKAAADAKEKAAADAQKEKAAADAKEKAAADAQKEKAAADAQKKAADAQAAADAQKKAADAQAAADAQKKAEEEIILTPRSSMLTSDRFRGQPMPEWAKIEIPANKRPEGEPREGIMECMISRQFLVTEIMREGRRGYLFTASDYPQKSREFYEYGGAILYNEDERYWKEIRDKEIGVDIFFEIVAQSLSRSVVLAYLPESREAKLFIASAVKHVWCTEAFRNGVTPKVQY
ncbi:hypothetical protein V2G26_010764 [Clonostachys chloroleuca]